MQEHTDKNLLYIQIGKNIARLRKGHDMKQAQLAKLLHISIKHCSAVERGRSSLSLEKMVALCRFFDVSLDSLIRDDSMPVNTVETEDPVEKNIT